MNIPGVEFTPAADLLRVTASGYARELSACVRLCRSVAQQGRSKRILLFGYSGVGKTTFIKALAYSLCSEPRPYNLLEIACGKLAAIVFDPATVRKDLAQVQRDLVAPAEHKPLIVALDELDAIAGYRVQGSAQDQLCFWTMNFLRANNGLLDRTITFCITNVPENLDPAVQGMENCLYLPLPTVPGAAALLQQLGMDATKANAVAIRLFQLTQYKGLRLTCNSLSKGYQEAFLDPVPLGPTSTVDEWVQRILIHGHAPGAAAVADYERDHKPDMERSEGFLGLYA